MIHVNADGLTEALTRIFGAAGGNETEARAIAANLVEASLSGHDSHGVIRTERYVYWSDEGSVRFGLSVKVISEAPGFALMDGQFGFGQTIGPQ
ncbi:MAG: malate dehydrogenase, partial [Xanthomonadales bacterium]|nr:malate dehydrogenase [Xanthomonadales bacterium]